MHIEAIPPLCATLVGFVSILALHTAAASPPNPIAAVPSPTHHPVPAGAPLALNLEEAIALTLRDNRTIKSAYLQRVSERFDLFAIERAFVPVGGISSRVVRRSGSNEEAEIETVISPALGWRSQLGTTVGFVWERRELLGDSVPGPSNAASLSVDQPLLRGAGMDVNMAPIRIARLQDKINQLRLEATIADTVTSTIFAHRALTQAYEQVRLAELSLERTRALLETNRAMIEAGRMAASDIVQTESAVANQEVAFLRTRQDLNSAQLALSQLLAIDPRTSLFVTGTIKAEQVVINVDQVLALALESRVDVLGQRSAVEQARHALIVARNDRLWDWSAFGSVTLRQGGDTFPGTSDDRTDFVGGLRLNIPIGDVSAERDLVRASTNLQISELRYKELTQAVETQVRDAVQQVEAQWQQVKAARRARELANRALDLQQEKLRLGRGSNFEVLSFQADLRTADIQELSAEIAYLNALAALDQQIGSTLDTWRITVSD